MTVSKKIALQEIRLISHAIKSVLPVEMQYNVSIDNLKKKLEKIEISKLTPRPKTTPRENEYQDLAAKEANSRRVSNKIFSEFSDIFGEPVWDIMLFIYRETGRDNVVSVTSACYASGVPLTTALRKIAKIEKLELVIRVDDPFDGRRQYLHLTDRGESLMRSYFDRI